jgi:hypothetical protein
MTVLSYMTRSDWAQNGTAMAEQSALVRHWLGERQYVFAVTDTTKLNDAGRPADVEVIDYMASSPRQPVVVDFAALRGLGDGAETAVVAVHPYEDRELESIRHLVEAGGCDRVFVMLWSETDRILPWLKGLEARDLAADALPKPLHPLLVEAGKMITDVDYNGLSSGRGKDTVVHLVRALRDGGVPPDSHVWLQAYFAAGGDFRHSPQLEKLVREVYGGVKHRVAQRFEGDVLEILRARAERPSDELDD